jgi:hypothetical protein
VTAPRRKRDLRLLAAAAALLLLPAGWFVWSSRGVRQRREATIAGVPEFPAPGQQPRRRPFPVGQHVPPPPPVAPAPPAPRQDPIASFVAQPASRVGLVHVNALFNTPLFDRMRQCLPEEFRQLEGMGAERGIDLTRDVDRIALAPGGIAVSGFFEGKPLAESLVGPGASSGSYRGQTILSQGQHCAVQMANFLLSSNEGKCEALIDRALAPAPSNAQEEIYGDVFFRIDLSGLRGAEAPPELRFITDGLDGITLRANVWDSVALTVEGAPRSGRDARELAQMARGAVALAKGQLEEDQVELQALADLAQVST